MTKAQLIYALRTVPDETPVYVGLEHSEYHAPASEVAWNPENEAIYIRESIETTLAEAITLHKD